MQSGAPASPTPPRRCLRCRPGHVRASPRHRHCHLRGHRRSPDRGVSRSRRLASARREEHRRAGTAGSAAGGHRWATNRHRAEFHAVIVALELPRSRRPASLTAPPPGWLDERRRLLATTSAALLEQAHHNVGRDGSELLEANLGGERGEARREEELSQVRHRRRREEPQSQAAPFCVALLQLPLPIGA